MTMPIDFNNHLTAPAEVISPFFPTPQFSPTESIIDFHETEPLVLALHHQPEVRQAQVEHALSLIGQVPWPPVETIQRIAKLLATEFDPLHGSGTRDE